MRAAFGSTLYCECNSIMMFMPEKRVACVNSSCEHFNVLYERPTVELVKVKTADDALIDSISTHMVYGSYAKYDPRFSEISSVIAYSVIVDDTFIQVEIPMTQREDSYLESGVRKIIERVKELGLPCRTFAQPNMAGMKPAKEKHVACYD